MEDRPSDPRGIEKFMRRNGTWMLTTTLVAVFVVAIALFTEWTTAFLAQYGKTVGQSIAVLYLLVLTLTYTPALFRRLRKWVKKLRKRYVTAKLRKRREAEEGESEEDGPLPEEITDHFRGMGGRRSLAMLIAAGGLSLATVYLTHFTSEEAWMFNDTAIQTAKVVLVCFIWLPLLNWTLLYEYDLWDELVTKRNGALGRFVLGLCVILALIYG
jgi:TRAP-type uncharacterized transport system fused permease subunit